MAALLVKATELRVQLLETLERGERTGNSAQIPLVERQQIEHIPIFGYLRAERLGRRQRLSVAPAPREVANLPHLALDERGLRRCDLRFGGHGIHAAPGKEKAGIAARLRFYGNRPEPGAAGSAGI